MTQIALTINFPNAQRSSLSDSKLYSFAQVKSMDDADEDYILHLTVRAAEPTVERLLADTCTRAINAAPEALSAMQSALTALDSVAFLSEEGDTAEVKRALQSAMASLAVPSLQPVPGGAQ